jgi:3-oxoacyl-[acyl-carrier protein] reductase
VAEYAELRGRVALVTGGSGGLGAATSRLLARNGVRVAVNGRNAATVDAVVDSIAAEGGDALGVVADCTDAGQLQASRERIEAELGPLDFLAAFAGGDGVPRPVAETGEQEWRETIDRNLTATFLTLSVFLPGMVERRRGSVVLMASATARVPRPGMVSPAYAVSKAGVMFLSKHVADEVGPFGVRVNCVSPSLVLTDIERAKRTPADEERLAGTVPLRRLGAPEDVAAATVFLASDAASWVTGVTLDVAGGRVMP